MDLPPDMHSPTASHRPAPYVSVVLSFWNESEVIPELVRQLRAVFVGLLETAEVKGYELVFINDASTDHSEALLRREGAAHGDIRLINMSRNFGLAPCIMAGFRYASGDVVIYMDADLQDPPSLIPQLVRTWRSDPKVEVVHTVRSARHGESKGKKALTWLGYRVLHGTSSVEMPIEAGDFKLLSRRVVNHLLSLEEARPFVRGLVRWVGYKQAVVTYEREARFAGDTKFPVLGARVILNFLESALISQSEAPIRILYILGGGSLAVALLFALALLMRALMGMPIDGWTWVLGAVLFLGAFQLCGLAVLGLYLGNVFVASRRRPPYLVQDTFGFPEARADVAEKAHTPFPSSHHGIAQ